MENKNNKIIRVYVSDDLKDYVAKQSKAFCMSESAYVNMCIGQYRMQCSFASGIVELKEQIDRLEKSVGKDV